MPVQVLGTRGAGYQTQARECYTHRVKTSDFSSGKSHWCPLQSRSLGTPVILALWLILAFSALLPCPQPSVHILAFPGFGFSEIKVGSLFSVLKSGHWSHSLSPRKGNSFSVGSRVSLWDGMMQQNKAIVPSLLCSYSVVLFWVFFLGGGGLFCSLLYCIADASETYLRALPSCFCFCIAKY